MTGVRDQRRVLETFTSRAEKRLLVWLAERMPSWVTPDRLSALGIGGAALVFAGYALSAGSRWYLLVATFGLAVNWLGDSADGTLARVRHIERPKYGFFVDHTVDVVSEALVILGLGASPYVRMDVAALAYAGYLAMSVLVYVRAFVDGIFRISYSRIGPTELRLLLAAATGLMFFFGSPRVQVAGTAVGAYDVLVGLVAAALAAAFLVSARMGLSELEHVDAKDARSL